MSVLRYIKSLWLLDFEALDSAWSNGATALARAGIGRFAKPRTMRFEVP